MIPVELGQFLQSGISILCGTRSDRLLPEASRAVGARVAAGGAELIVFLPAATAERMVADLRENARLAVCFSRAIDHRSVQVKGRVVAIAEASEEDRQEILRYRSALAAAWAEIGIPPRITLRMAHWPCHAIRMQVESVFDQTPGPGAGNLLGSPGVARSS